VVAAIIEELQAQNQWGSFLPISLSLFPYNDTVSNDYNPIQKIIIN